MILNISHLILIMHIFYFYIPFQPNIETKFEAEC